MKNLLFPMAVLSMVASLAQAALTPVTIGSASGSATDLGGGAYRLTGSGVRPYNNEGDELQFAYEQVTGDFDKKVKVKSISKVASDWNRGGIQVRDSLEPVARVLEVTAIGQSSETDDNGNAKGVNQVRLYGRTSPDGNYSSFGRVYPGVADALPNQWLRLRRVGNQFEAYVGTDGVNWSLAVQRYADGLPAAVYVGLYAGSASDLGDVATTVDFENYGNTAISDASAPSLVSAGTIDKKVVGVKFSEQLASASVSPAKFTVSGATVTGAKVGIGGDSVYLAVTGLTADTFTVTVNGVTDFAGNPVRSNASVAGSVAPGWKAVDVGSFASGDPANRAEGDDPILPGQTVAVRGGARAEVEIVAGGSNIWNPGDFQHYVYTEKTGDFDVIAEVSRFDRSANTSTFGHAGIQVRESLYLPGQEYTATGTKVRTVMNTTYAEGNIGRTAITLWRDTPETGGYGNSPVVGDNTPDANGVVGRWGNLRASNAKGDLIENTSSASSRWLRLKRVGNEFYSYWSYNGIDWTESASSQHTSELPAKVLVGFAEMADSPGITGNNLNQPWHYNTLVVRNLGDYTATPTVSGLATAKIGTTQGGADNLGGGSYTVTGGGVRPYNAEGDELVGAYERVTGDFDKVVKIKSISKAASDWNRGGIQVRESLDAKTRVLEVAAIGQSSETDDNGNAKGVNQVRLYGRTSPDSDYSSFGRVYPGVADALPNQWLRLRRVGNQFQAYVGTDGKNWSLAVQRFADGMPASVYVGLYAGSASEQGDALTTVEFESYGDAPISDSTAPALVSAGSLDKKVVGVKFSEQVNSASVSPAKFTVSGATVTGAKVGVNGDSVYLTVSGLTANSFTVTVNGVTDFAGNAIAAGASVSGKAASGWSAIDVGSFASNDPASRAEGDDPIRPGQTVAVNADGKLEVEIVAGGSNIWNPGDFQHYVYTTKTGDFDVVAEVSRFDRSANTSTFGHAGIQVRESLYLPGQEYTATGTKVRTVMNTTYAEGNIGRTAITLWRDTPETGGYGNSPVIGDGTPDANGIIGRWGNLRAANAKGDLINNTSPSSSRWLRLKRVGNEFYSYWSYNGIDWTETSSSQHNSELPATVLVGFAEMADSPGVTGNNLNQPWHYNTLTVRNLGDFGSTTPTPATLSVERSGNNIVIRWDGTGTLQSAASLSGPWAPVAGAASGVSVPASANNAFFRVVR